MSELTTLSVSSPPSPALWPLNRNAVQSFESWLEEWSEYGISRTDVDSFLARITVTPEDQKMIMYAPQGSPKWLESRGKRLTASNFGAVCKQNPFSSPNRVLQGMLWPHSFDCEAMRFGRKYEKTAVKLFEETMVHKEGKKERGGNGNSEAEECISHLSFPGLVVPLEKPWLGASPDGIVHLKNGRLKGLEIKCPFKQEIYPYCPAYYYAQVQGTAGLLGLSSYYFQVWTPKTCLVEEYAFDRAYFWDFMMPQMESFYFEQYLPLAILKDKGQLQEDNPLTPLPPSFPNPASSSELASSVEPWVSQDPPGFVWAS